MAIPSNISKQDIVDAIQYIDNNGVPDRNKSNTYELVTESGKKYPPKYVIAVADHLANNSDIATDSFISVEAVKFLRSKGFTIHSKQDGYFAKMVHAPAKSGPLGREKWSSIPQAWSSAGRCINIRE